MGGTELQHENEQMFFFSTAHSVSYSFLDFCLDFFKVSGIGRDLREGEGVGMS